MEQAEIIEGNKLIVQFMKIEKGMITETGFQYWKIAEGFHVSTEELKYHSSWDWLIPVMEKIGKDYNVRITWCADGGSKGFDTTYIDRADIFDSSLADFGGFGPITNTWKCAVKFIKWHNKKFKIKYENA